MRSIPLVRVSGLLGLVLLVPVPAGATGFAPTIPQRVADADIVVIGRVKGVERKTVTVAVPNAPPTALKELEYQIVTVTVQENILGAKKDAELRLGVQIVDLLDGRGPARRVPLMNVAPGQQALLFLKKHPTADFYPSGTQYLFIDKRAAGFDKDLAAAKRCAELLGDPEKYLSSKNAEERLTTAGLLLGRYLRPSAGEVKREPIPAQESKLILLALADGEWDKLDSPSGFAAPLLFYQLGLKEADGWTPPKDVAKVRDEATKWLRANADKYRIQRVVPVKAETK
jgi:hypothetical protein